MSLLGYSLVVYQGAGDPARQPGIAPGSHAGQSPGAIIALVDYQGEIRKGEGSCTDPPPNMRSNAILERIPGPQKAISPVFPLSASPELQLQGSQFAHASPCFRQSQKYIPG